MSGQTGIYNDFYSNFNRILLSENSLWFNGNSREDLFLKAWQDIRDRDVKPWSERKSYTMKHVIFGDALPDWLGFNRGPYLMPGGRATVHQGQIFESAGRTTSFAPSCRILADMGEKELSINLSGGVSDRRFSKYYCNRMSGYLENESIVLSPGQ